MKKKQSPTQQELPQLIFESDLNIPAEAFELSAGYLSIYPTADHPALGHSTLPKNLLCISREKNIS